MNKRICIFILTGLLSVCLACAQSIKVSGPKLLFEWDLKKDEAKITDLTSKSNIWKGSMLPGWWLLRNGKKDFIKATFISLSAKGNDNWTARLQVGQAGTGTLKISRNTQGLQFDKLSVQWKGVAPAIISMYYGVRSLNPAAESVAAAWDKPFMPDWEAAGYCWAWGFTSQRK